MDAFCLMHHRNCHCKTLFKISQYGGTARRAGVFKTCRCGDDRISRDRNHDHGILGKQGSDRTCGDEVESGSDFCGLYDITSKSKMNPIWVMVLAGVMKVGMSLI